MPTFPVEFVRRQGAFYHGLRFSSNQPSRGHPYPVIFFKSSLFISRSSQLQRVGRDIDAEVVATVTASRRELGKVAEPLLLVRIR